MMASQGYIPDFSTATRYATVVMNTRDDLRLLALSGDTIMGGIIPDFSTAPLYATVVMNTRDDPRLLALWCNIAIWRPIDREIGLVTKEMWVERTGFTLDTIESLARTLMERGLLTAQGAIAWYPLQQASWDDVLPYSNELRRRDGLREMPPQQQRLEV